MFIMSKRYRYEVVIIVSMLGIMIVQKTIRHPSSGFHWSGSSLRICRHAFWKCWWLRIVRIYVVHVHLHWAVPNRQLEGVDNVGTKDVQLVGDSKLQYLRVDISNFCGNSHIEVNRARNRNDIIRCRYHRTCLILLKCRRPNLLPGRAGQQVT